MDIDEQIVLARREEAQALLQAGLSARERADRTLAIGFTVTGVAAAAGIANDFVEVVIAVPTVLFLLLAYQFFVYADLVAFGMGRARIEAVLAEQLGTEVLIAETIAPSRHSTSNVSFHSALVTMALLVTGATVVGAIEASDHGVWAVCAFAAATTASGATAVFSYLDLFRTWREAGRLARDWPIRAGRVDPPPPRRRSSSAG